MTRGQRREALRLARRAGEAGPVFDQLEERKLLSTNIDFTLNPSDPFFGANDPEGLASLVDNHDGTYTATVEWGYLIPYLIPADPPTFQAVDPRLEDFEEDDVTAFVPSGTIFGDSAMRADHNLTQLSVIQNLDIDGNPVEGSQRFRMTLADVGDQITLGFLTAEDRGEFTGITSFSMFISSGVGINTDETVVELLARGDVITSFTGAALRALSDTNGGLGLFTFDADGAGFDQVRFRKTGDSANQFDMDNIQGVLPPTTYVELIDTRTFGAEMVFTGPLGAGVRVLDLVGNPMKLTLRVGTVGGSDAALSDLNGDGIPEINDGILRIEMTGTDENTSFGLFGGTIDDQNNALVFTLVDNITGLYDDFESAVFGYAVTLNNGTPTATGLPNGPGSVIVGSPFIRDPDNYNPDGFVIDPIFGSRFASQASFTRADQGLFVLGGTNIGEVYVHGVVHGSSQFTGFVERAYIGYLVGSMSVAGDLGSLYVGSDAGAWYYDPDFDTQDLPVDPIFRTGAELVVGRTLGQFTAGGRSLLDVTVVGDLNNPTVAPPMDVLTYIERERAYGIDPNATGAPEATVARIISNTFRAPILADSMFRNDSILASEFVSNISTSVRIFGSLGLQDGYNTAEDIADVFGFVADGMRPVIVESAGSFNVRIMDSDGRTLRAVEGARDDTVDLSGQQQLVFTPDAAGVYYLVIGAQGGGNASDGDFDSIAPYEVLISGMAPVALGAYRTAAGSGASFFSNTFGRVANTVSVLNGSAGSLRVGTGLYQDGGGEGSPADVINQTEADDDALFEFRAGTFSVAGSLWNITAGSDVGGFTSGRLGIFVGEHFGSLITGISAVASDGDPGREGDLSFFSLEAGGSVAVLDVRGGVGIENDVDPAGSAGGASTVVIRTGTDGGSGDIGLFRVGGHVRGVVLDVITSPGSRIDAFLISQDIDPTTGGTLIGMYGDAATFTTGIGSDVRFVDFPQIDSVSSPDSRLDLIGGTPIEIVDDGGARVRIQIANAIPGFNYGLIRFLPIDGSEGVAIGEIEANLANGETLLISSFTNEEGDVVSIGTIQLTGTTAQSQVLISGNSEIDIWRIIQTGGVAFNTVQNLTAGGDIFSLDVIGLNRIVVLDGHLGQTETYAVRSHALAPFLGVQAGENTTVGAAVGITGNGAVWNGALYRPTDSVPDGLAGFGDDNGLAMNPYLAGAVIRTGSVQEVRVSGSIGNVYLQGGPGTVLTSLRANADRSTPTGGFHGIFGVIYADVIVDVDVGDGLMDNVQSPILFSGVIAADDIGTVRATITGSFISGVVGAANTLGGGGAVQDGIGLIEMTGGGDITSAEVLVATLHTFWNAATNVDESASDNGAVNLIRSTNGSIFRSRIFGRTITTIDLTNGYVDATRIRTNSGIGRINAGGFRNSTIGGSSFEFRRLFISAGADLGSLTTTMDKGDIRDLTLDVNGDMDLISARHIVRTRIDVDNRIAEFAAGGDLSGSSIVAGQVDTMTIESVLASTTMRVSGPITELTAGVRIINSEIVVSGPDGRIEMVEAPEIIGSSFTASGRIVSITATEGDLSARITTTTARGSVETLEAARDLDIDTDISGTVTELIAGRHVGKKGSPRTILIHSGLETLEAGGQLYSDLRVGQTIDSVTLGRVRNRPGDNNLGTGLIEAFDRIELVEIEGDFNGSIISYTRGIGLVSITNGSFLAGNLIAAYDGNIDQVLITAGNLYGDIYADYVLYAVNVVASSDGVFGDIGVNPDMDPFVQADAFRNQLPPGVAPSTARQGPMIRAGWNLGRVTVTNGSVFETTIFAERAIGTITVNGDIKNDTGTTKLGSAIVANDSIYRVNVSGSIERAWIIAGIVDLGADMTPGGTGANADTNSSGYIETITASDLFAVVFAAGTNPGTDGLYNTADDLLEPGVSFVRTVTAPDSVAYVSGFSEAFSLDLMADLRFFLVGKYRIAVNSPDTAAGAAGTAITAGSPFSFTHGAETGTITFTGVGAAYWDAANGRVILDRTSTASNLTVTSDSGSLTDFVITTTNDASVEQINILADLLGDSRIVVDAYAQTIITGDFDGTGGIYVGQHATTITTGSFRAAQITAKNAAFLTIGGDFGSSTFDTRGASRIDILSSGFFTVTGNLRGHVNVERVVGTTNVGGAIDNALFRVGSAAGSVTAASVRESRVSIRDFITTFTTTGDVFDTSILVGGDLGPDGDYDTISGASNDEVSTGSGAFFDIGGDFIESDIIGGGLRGADGFHGTDDDRLSQGRSVINSVIIRGTAYGSNRESEAYRIASTGSINKVTVSGLSAVNSGNFEVGAVDTSPLPIRVDDVRVTLANSEYTARLFFNQPMDRATFSAALSVSEVRGASGETTITLIEGTDYRIGYEPEDRAMTITFSRSVTRRDLPQVAGVPGPGLYRFELDQDVLRAALQQARLDGDGDGVVRSNDDFSTDDIVGDAGDRLTAQSITTTDPITGADRTLDFYAPVNLDVLLDSNHEPDGLADPNNVFTIRGTIGDHPDHHSSVFRFAGDLDLYSITLEAGQILRLGAMSGSALFATQLLLAPSGAVQPTFGATGDTVALPTNPLSDTDLTGETNYLIKTTGTYTLLVGNGVFSGADLSSSFIYDIAAISGGVGDYAFTFEVFDDDNSGFDAATDAGDGDAVVNAPDFSTFAGSDGLLGTADDVAGVTRGAVRFTYSAGADGVAGTADDLITGDNDAGIVSIRSGDGTLTSTVASAIGAAGYAGVPGDVTPDVDIYHLNNRQAIDAGTRVRITLGVTETGGDLGSRTLLDFVDFSGSVQFGLFDTTDATDIDDAVLVFSPTDFSPIGGTPGTTLADNGSVSYGFNNDGDFYIEFVTPEGDPAKYAIYVQGVFNTDYTLEIVTDSDSGALDKKVQNVLIELNGGDVDWLQTGGATTLLDGFDLAAIGFTGTLSSGQSIDEYVTDLLISNLQAVFDNAGLDVRFSTNPTDFEFQDFSTVFISTSPDPVNPLGFFGFGFTSFGFFGLNPYGYSQHSDALNADLNDEAVVFLPALGLHAYPPTESDLQLLAGSLTGAVGRRVGELMGLRLTEEALAGGDLLAADSVLNTPGLLSNDYFIADSRALAADADLIENTIFFLGRQNAQALLGDLIEAP